MVQINMMYTYAQTKRYSWLYMAKSITVAGHLQVKEGLPSMQDARKAYLFLWQAQATFKADTGYLQGSEGLPAMR